MRRNYIEEVSAGNLERMLNTIEEVDNVDEKDDLFNKGDLKKFKDMLTKQFKIINKNASKANKKTCDTMLKHIERAAKESTNELLKQHEESVRGQLSKLVKSKKSVELVTSKICEPYSKVYKEDMEDEMLALIVISLIEELDSRNIISSSLNEG